MNGRPRLRDRFTREAWNYDFLSERLRARSAEDVISASSDETKRGTLGPVVYFDTNWCQSDLREIAAPKGASASPLLKTLPQAAIPCAFARFLERVFW